MSICTQDSKDIIPFTYDTDFSKIHSLKVTTPPSPQSTEVVTRLKAED